VPPAPPAPPAPAAPVATGSGPRSSSDALTVWQFLVVLLPLLGLLPLLNAHAEHLWEMPHYQFFPFVVLGAIALAWSRWSSAPRTAGDPFTATILAIAAWVVVVAGEAVASPSVSVVALELLLAAALIGLGGWPLFHAMLPAWLFLWLLMPLPFGLDRTLVNKMQLVASMASSAILDLLGVVHTLNGNVVRLTLKPLLVEEACAGLSSLLTVVACSLFLVLWLRRPVFRSILLILASIGWVLACNVLRIVIIAFLFDHYGPAYDFSTGMRHAALGFACFCLAILLIWSTDRFLLFFLPRTAEDATAAAPVSARVADPDAEPPLPPLRFADLARLASVPLAVLFGIVLAMHVALHQFLMPANVAPAGLNDRLEGLTKKSLPLVIEPYVQVNFKKIERFEGTDAYGRRSDEWIYAKDAQNLVVVSFDWPFRKFHDLSECYVGQGWQVDMTTFREKEGSKKPAVWSQMKLRQPGGRHGYAAFTALNFQGEAIGPEPRFFGALARHEQALQSLYDRIFRPDQFKAPKALGPTYQFQVFVNRDEPISAEQQQEAQEILFRTVRDLRRTITGTFEQLTPPQPVN
jgi:exosortase